MIAVYKLYEELFILIYTIYYQLITEQLRLINNNYK